MPNKQPNHTTPAKQPPLDYEQWYELNADELAIQFAESGADRELDFDPERAAECEYERYLQRFEAQVTQINPPAETSITTIFDVADYLPVYRNLPLPTLVEQFDKILHYAVRSCEDSTGALFGTIRLDDGREARVQVSIEAAYIETTPKH